MKTVRASAAAPTAEICTTRRMPASAQAWNRARMAVSCTARTSSRGPSWSTPAQFTTASQPAITGCHAAGSLKDAMSRAIQVASGKRRRAAVTSRPRATIS